jgi:hypothetical protein
VSITRRKPMYLFLSRRSGPTMMPRDDVTVRNRLRPRSLYLAIYRTACLANEEF